MYATQPECELQMQALFHFITDKSRLYRFKGLVQEQQLERLNT